MAAPSAPGRILTVIKVTTVSEALALYTSAAGRSHIEDAAAPAAETIAGKGENINRHQLTGVGTGIDTGKAALQTATTDGVGLTAGKGGIVMSHQQAGTGRGIADTGIAALQGVVTGTAGIEVEVGRMAALAIRLLPAGSRTHTGMTDTLAEMHSMEQDSLGRQQ